MKTQNYLLSSILLVASLWTSPAMAQQQSVQNCDPDLVAQVPANIDWDDAYIIRGDNDTAWQRSIFNQRTEIITVREGETFKIEGNAQPGAPVQVFIYTRSSNPAATDRPSNGVCFQINETDPSSGYFSLDVHASIIWPMIGKKIVLDAFSRLEDSWDQLQGAKTNQNYFIGTHSLPTIVDIVADVSDVAEIERASRQAAGTSGTCTTLCDSGRNIIESVFLDPANAPFPAIVNAFDAVGSQALQLARNEGGHTHYANAAGIDQITLQRFTDSAVGMEMLKQALLGIILDNKGGEVTGINSISATELINASTGSGSGNANASKLTNLVKDVITNNNRAGAAKEIADFVLDITYRSERVAKGVLDALPDNGTEANWAQYFVDSMAFWTGSLEPNTCLVLCDGSQRKNISGKIRDRIKCDGANGGPVVTFEYVQGVSPRLVLSSSEEVKLKPSFDDVLVTYASKMFDTGEQQWTLASGNKDTFYYRYAFLKDYGGGYVGEACVAKSDVERYASTIADSLRLNAQEKQALVAELHSGITSEDGYYAVQVADPDDIATRFAWKDGDAALDIFQLFFAVEQNACAGTYFGDIDATNTAADGFEAGILIES